MFEKKTVKQLVEEFLKKVQLRESKVKESLTALKAKAAGHQKKIDEQTAAIVEYELSSDAASAEALRKSNRTLSSELTEMNAEIAAYEKQSGSSADYSKDLEKIQAASQREVKENHDKSAAIYQELQDIDQQIKALEARKKEIATAQHHLQHNGPEKALERILEHLDPRVRKLSPHSFELNNFLFHWARGEDVEHIFAQQPAINGDKAKGEFQQSTPRPQIHTATFQGEDKAGALERWKSRNPQATIVDTNDTGHGPLEIRYTVS